MDSHHSYTPDFFKPELNRYSVEATMQIFVYSNSSLSIYAKSKINNYFGFQSQIESQCNTGCFVIVGHIYITLQPKILTAPVPSKLFISSRETPTNSYYILIARPTFIAQCEASHLWEVFESLKADDPCCL